MAELSLFTKQMQAMLPQWMKMAKDPTSVGARFLNVFGMEFADVKAYLDVMSSNQFVGVADLSQIDISYKVPVAVPSLIDMSLAHTIIGMKGDLSYSLKLVDTIAEFYSANADDHVAILDRDEGLVYIRPANELIATDKFAPYDYITIDGAVHYDMILHHIWNTFDEFGLLLGTSRLYGERNAEFKERILDVFVNPANSTKQGLINAISRELGIQKDHVVINELADSAFKGSLLNPDGSPTRKLIGYAQQINKVLGFTWDNMSWDEAYWKSISEANIGLDYLPHVWDPSMDLWTNEEFQSGIGDDDDLLVTAPVKQDNIRNFDYYVGLRGVRKAGQLIYPEHSFKYKVLAKGTILNQESKPQNYKYTVISSEIIYLYFIIRAFQQYLHTDTFDFSNMTGVQFDSQATPGVEVVSGTAMMSPKADLILEIEAFLETKSKSATPKLETLTVKWKDTTGGTHDFIMDTQVDFDRNDPTVQVTKENVVSTSDGHVELGFGDFYHVLDTKGDWEKGTIMNVEILPEGSIRLIRPKL